MKAIFLIFLCIGGAFSVKQPANFAPVCDECQEVVNRFNKASKDHTKMTLMKEVLSGLCHQTGYEEECKMLVAKLDIIVAKLSSYLENSQAVCTQFNMCSNSRIDRFRRIGLLFAKQFLNKIDGSKDLICEECQFASHELLEVFDDHDTQAQIHDFMSEKVCAHLGEYSGTCDTVVKDVLPNLFQEFHNMLSNGKQFCADLKLCTLQQVNLPRLTANEMKNKIMGPKHVQNLLKTFQNLKTPEPHNLAMSCMECQILADIALDELKTANMIDVLSKVLKGVLCTLLPEEFGCGDFVDTYGNTVVYMTVQQFDSESLCEALQMCTQDSKAQVSKHSKAELSNMKCSSCESLSNFLNVELSKPKSKSEIIYGLQYLICKEAPKSLYDICGNFVGGLLPEAYDKFAQFVQENKACKTLRAC